MRSNQASEGEARRFPLWAGAITLVVAVLFWLAVALRTTGPLVLADEYVYAIRGIALDHFDRLAAAAPSMPTVGNYLFLRFINLIARAHLPVELSVKLYNVTCYGIATYLIGVRILRKGPTWRAAGLFALIAFLPVGSFVAYAMPESAYLLIFVVVFYLLSGATIAKLYRLWSILGALIAGLVLTKAHGLFVFAAFLGATGIWAAFTGRISLAKALWLGLTSTASFVATLAFGLWLFGPAHGMSSGDVVGPFYWSIVSRAVSSWDRVAGTANFAATLASAILLLLAPSLTYLAFEIVADRRGERTAQRSSDLMSFCACFLIGELVVVVLVVAFLLGAEPDRIQLRYVDFTFPCILALVWLWQSKPVVGDPRGFRYTAALVWVVAAAVFLRRLPSLHPLAADSPEMFFSYRGGEFGAFGLGPATSWVVAGLVLAGAGAILHPKVRWFDAQLLVLFALGVVANVNTLTWQERWSASQAPLRAVGEAARTSCGVNADDVVAVGPPDHVGQLYTAMAGLARPAKLQLSTDAAIDPTHPPAGCVITTWDMDALWSSPLIRGAGVSLYRRATAWHVDGELSFDAGIRPSVLGRGWSGPEGRGVWTDGRLAMLRVDLPKAAKGAATVVEFDAVAFAPPPRSAQRVEVSANGQSLATWIVQDGAYFARLPPTREGQRSIDLELRFPNALAPASVLPGVADRRLPGIAVRRIKVLHPASAATSSIVTPATDFTPD